MSITVLFDLPTMSVKQYDSVIKDLDASGRYVRFYGYGFGSNPNYRMAEFEVYEKD